MNRYLAIPMGLTLIGFVAVCAIQTSFGSLGDRAMAEPAIALTALDNPTITKTSTSTSTSTPMAFADAKVTILDRWPTLGKFQIMSRMGPTQPLYANLGELAQEKAGKTYRGDALHSAKETGNTGDGSSFLCTLYISSQEKDKGRPYKHEEFPVHVDRFSGEAHIFVDSKWQEYSQWRDQALPAYEHSSGFSKQKQVVDPVLGRFLEPYEVSPGEGQEENASTKSSAPVPESTPESPLEFDF